MRRIEIVQNILEANESIAAQNQRLLDKHKVFAVNIMSSPGAGKTSLILQTMAKLKNKLKIAVVEGDVCLLYTSPSPRDATLSRMPSSA